MNRPEKGEFDPYYERYISLVDGNDVVPSLTAQPIELRELLGGLSEERGLYAYADGKWSIKEVIGHLNDGERMFAYRLHRISRGDTTPIEGFEQDGYIENARSNSRPLGDLVEEFRLLRTANLFMINHLEDHDWRRMGTASGLAISVRALAYIMAGHVTHHTAILRDRYAV